MVTDAPRDMSEVFALTREAQEAVARPVETRSVPQGMGPVVYCTVPFRKYVPPPLAPVEPESESRSRWRLDRFRSLGLLIGRDPYPTPWGLHWTARLLWPGMEWNSKKTENHDRHFAVSLDDGTWSHIGTHQQMRPFAELTEYLAGLGLPSYLESSLEETPAGPSSSAGADLGPMAEPSHEEPPAVGVPVPAPAAVTEDHASYLAECEAAGLAVERTPWDAEGTSYRARFRCHSLTVHPRSRAVVFGLKEPGGRRYTRMSLAQAIEAIDLESNTPRPSAPTQKETSPAAGASPSSEASTSAPDHSQLSEPTLPGGLSPVRPSTPETGLATPSESPLGSTGDSTPAVDMPERDERPLSEPPRQLAIPPPSAALWTPAATAAGTGRFFRTLSAIPRIGGAIPAGVELELLALYGDRGNFARGGRLVLCDCPLDHFTEVLCA